MGKDKKTCTKCNETKELTEFNLSKKSKDGRHSYCKPCRRDYRKRNKKKRTEYMRSFREKNYDSWIVKRREYQRKRYQEDPAFRLANIVSATVRHALAGRQKTKKTFEALPYTLEQLMQHLESQFEDWMTWDNHGKWHIDHIYPQSKLPYDSLDHPNFQKCWALENLRPLEARENIIKSNKII